MALNQNPFFIPIMQSIEMISQDNLRKQAEDREYLRQQNLQDQAYERQIQTEERSREYETKVREQQANESEMQGLQQSVNAYLGAEGQGVELNEVEKANFGSMTKRMQSLIEQGVKPRSPKYAAPQDESYLAPEVAKWAADWPQDKPVDVDTKRILTIAYKNWKLSQAKDKSGGAGEKDKLRDPLEIIKARRDLAHKRIEGLKEEGDTEKLGPAMKIQNAYIEKLDGIEAAILLGKIDEKQAIEQLMQIPDFDRYYVGNEDESDNLEKVILQIKEELEKD